MNISLSRHLEFSDAEIIEISQQEETEITAIAKEEMAKTLLVSN